MKKYKKTITFLFILGSLLAIVGYLGSVVRSQSHNSGLWLGIVEPAPSLDGKIMNFLLQPSMIFVGAFLILLGIYLRHRK